MAGAAVFIYLTDCLVKGEAHGISQIIAAGPAGFQRPKGAGSCAAFLPGQGLLLKYLGCSRQADMGVLCVEC